jgi:hypothetical protein
MARAARFLGWGAGLLAVAVFAIYALGPIDAFPGMRLGGTPSDPPTSWADVNEEDDIFIETEGVLPWVVRTWYAGMDDGLYVFAYRDSSWRRRIEAMPNARVRIGDATFAVHAVAIDLKSKNEALGIAYREKYSHYIDAEQYGQAMAEAAAEVLDDARRRPVFQLLRLDPVE